MKLRFCNIRLQASYEKNAGKYIAEIGYESSGGDKVEMILDPEISAQLLGFIGPAITKFAHKAALEVEANLIQSVQEAKRPAITV